LPDRETFPESEARTPRPSRGDVPAEGDALSARPVGGLVLLGVLTVLWGSNWPAMKLALRELDPWTFRTICLLVGGGGLLALVRMGGQSLRVPRLERRPLALAAFFNITAWHLCSAYGLTLVQAGRAAIIAYTMPLWTVIFARLLVRERITPRRLAALGLGLAGMAALVAPGASALWHEPAGILLMVGAAGSWAFGTVLIKAQRWTIPISALTGWQVILGAVPIALGALLRSVTTGDSGVAARLTTLSSAALLGTAYATFVGVIFCHWAWFRLVSILPAAVASIGTLGIPIVGLFTSALVLGEPVGMPEIVALVLVVGGLAILIGGMASGAAESPTGSGAVSTIERRST
jgi:drug/metabolite transporter (DMT)-like permease